MNGLSISSHVAYGHVGNSAAVFALQRLGIEAWPVDTVVKVGPNKSAARSRAVATAEDRS